LQADEANPPIPSPPYAEQNPSRPSRLRVRKICFTQRREGAKKGEEQAKLSMLAGL
jgi:hypothetical protein